MSLILIMTYSGAKFVHHQTSLPMTYLMTKIEFLQSVPYYYILMISVKFLCCAENFIYIQSNPVCGVLLCTEAVSFTQSSNHTNFNEWFII